MGRQSPIYGFGTACPMRLNWDARASLPPIKGGGRGFAADTALTGYLMIEPDGRKNGPVNNAGPLFFIFSQLLHCFTHFCGGFPRTA